MADRTFNKMVTFMLIAFTALAPYVLAESSNVTICKDGAVFPKWKPVENLSAGDRVTRGLVYMATLFYLFVGVVIVTSRLMVAVEVIASPEKEITVVRKKGEPQIVRVRFWNKTILNLTLMVLASSALEIFLPIVELFGKDMEITGLSFGTIMGCAAFRLHLIIALCVFVVPSNEKRTVKYYDVLLIVFLWSLIAYVWVVGVLDEYSPRIVKVWEAVITLLFFPITLLMAYMDDQRFSILNWLCHKYQEHRKGPNVTSAAAAAAAAVESGGKVDNVPTMRSSKGVVKDFEKTQRNYITILHDIRRSQPNCDMETLEKMAMEEIMVQFPKTRAFYWIQANRKFTGSDNLIKKKAEIMSIDQPLTKTQEDEPNSMRVFLDQQRIAVNKHVSKFSVTVKRAGDDLSKTVSVDVHTEDGTAKAGYDYLQYVGTLYFQSWVDVYQFTMTIIDSKIFKEERHFFVHLSNLQLCNQDGTAYTSDGEPTPSVQLVSPTTTTILILDDNHCGIFSFVKAEYEFPECISEITIKITRFGGTYGQVNLFYATSDGTAKTGEHYQQMEGAGAFYDSESEFDLTLKIEPEYCFEEDLIFYIDLTDCKQVKDGDYMEYAKETTKLNEEQRSALNCKPRLGEITRAQIKIKKNKEFKDTLVKLFRAPKPAFIVGGTSWKEQLTKAITVPAGDSAVPEDGTDFATPPSYFDYGVHFLTIFWKIICAAIPPAGLIGGWPCVVASVLLIALLACFILDLGCALACTLEVPDFIIGITFMTAGICIPDLFASKLAAVDDKHADSSVTYMTGSIGIIVYVGVGINWFIGSIYHVCVGSDLEYTQTSVVYPAVLFQRIGIAVMIFLLLRRLPFVGGELGGPMMFKIPSILFFIACWLAFVIMTIVELT